MAIDRNKIIDELSKISIIGNNDGIIDAYGVFMQQLPSSFWNNFSEKLTRSVPEDLLETAEWLLVNAAQECGYHTGYGIINSMEWKSVVVPMLENDSEDILHGIFAVLSAWGWAKAVVKEIIAGERMVIHAYDYYEADIVEYGKSDKLSAYTLTGVSAAFMDLVYGGKYDSSGLTGLRTFSCKQTKGIECGDDFGEFIVSRV